MKKVVYILMCMCLVLSACDSEQTTKKKAKKKAVTAKVQSAPYELLVVANKDWLKTGAGQSLIQVVEAPVEVLPQIEPNFRVTSVNPEAFNGVFRTYANIVCADVDKKYKEPELRMATNVYARPQKVLYVNAPDNSSFEKYMAECGKMILRELNENEFSRERGLLAKQFNGAVQRQAKKQFGIDIKVPQNIDDMKTGKDFLWASASKQEFRQNVCLYTLPLSTLSFAEARDSVMKINIPGGREDQWMETDRRTVITDEITRNDLVVIRGLWGMRNDAMGGPFVCYCYADTLHNRFLVAEGFVYAPEEKKRPIMRQLEAALQTVALQ